MFGRVNIYTVHVRHGDSGARHRPLFVKEGFNVIAFALPLLWVLYKRLWIPALLIAAFDLLFFYALKGQVLAQPSLTAIDIGMRVIVGYHANDWLRTYLRKRSFILTDISAADSLLRAEQRYFERFLAASAPGK